MKPKLKPIHDQVVVLFGATSGIGLDTAMSMVEKGARVAIVGRNQEGLNDALERVRSHAQASALLRGRGNGKHQLITSYDSPAGTQSQFGEQTGVHEMEEQVISIEADATDFEQVKSVAEQVMQRFGRIDTWVNVVAVSEWALFEDTSPEEFRRIIDVNLMGHAYGAMAALPYMRQQTGGSLIFVSSLAGRLPIPYQSAYNASKHAIIGLAETLRQELKHTRTPVNVTVILPASVNTPLFNKARTKLGVEPEPIPPIYDSKLVSKAILYASSHLVPELIVGDAGFAMNFMRRLAPTLANNMMGASGFRKQRSDEPKSAQDPDNLYHHLAGHNQVEGEFTQRTQSFSPLTWLATHPAARIAVYALLAGGAALLIGQRIRSNRRRRTLGYRVAHKAEGIGQMAAGLLDNLPLRRTPSMKDRVIDALPFVSRPTVKDRVTDFVGHAGDRLPDRMPFTHRPTVKDRVTDFVGHASDRMPDRMPFTHRPTVKDRVTDFVGHASDRLPDRLPFTHQPTLKDRVVDSLPVSAVAGLVSKAGDHLPSRSHSPFQRRRSFKDQVIDFLPFVHRKNFFERLADRFPPNDPFAPTLGERVASHIPSKHEVEHHAKKASGRLHLKETGRVLGEKVPTQKDIEKFRERLTERTHYVERKETFVAKLPDGIRKETTYEKIPYHKD
jgi:NAD(P)-dependent dehydrogenase (short-subunit alcohol dehydrogenase family)